MRKRSFSLAYLAAFALAWSFGLSSAPAGAQIAATATVTGAVTSSANHQPLAGALVQAGPASVRTDANGEYSLSFLLGGDMAIRVSKDGYKPAMQTLTVALGQTANLDFALDPNHGDDSGDHGHGHDDAGSIRGQVMDSVSGKGIAGATVAAGSASVHTDHEGGFEIENLAAGSYSLSAGADGYETETRQIALEAGQKLNLTLRLTPTHPTPTPPTTGSVAGTVTGEGGAPLAGATVSIGAASAVTDATGKYALDEIQTGSVVAIARAEGYVTSVKTVAVSADATAMADFALIPLPNPVPNKGSVHGAVVSETDASPIVGATVQLGDQTAQTGQSGEFLIENLDPGRAKITVSATGYKDKTVSVVVFPGLTSHMTVTLKPASTLPPPAATDALSGTVVAADGTPIAGAVVKSGDRITVTNAQGQFALSGIAAGSAKVEIAKPGYQNSEFEIAITENETTVLNVTLSEQTRPGHGGDHDAGRISGTVYDESGATIAGATVMLRGLRTITDASGAYSFAGLAKGNYNLQVWANGYLHTHKRIRLDAGQSVAADVTLRARTSDDEPDQGGDDNVGDANGDGRITINDAILLLRIALGLQGNIDASTLARLDVAPSKPRGDFGDGKADIKDVVKVLRTAVNLNLVLP
jgi:inhibitor of cysteine peptidase